MLSTKKCLHLQTPLIRSPSISAALRQNVYLKMECFQPAGSFKIRGIGLLCQHYIAAGLTRLVSSSGGNAGLAVAYAGHLQQIPVTVVVPSTTSERTRQRLRLYGAEVLVHGAVWDEADTRARELVLETSAAYIPPFDHPIIWEGHSSIIDEIHASGVVPDALVVAVGGGGLLCGVLEGMHRVGWVETPLIAVETEGAASLHASIENGKPTTLAKITTVATSLGARRVAQRAFEWTRSHPITSVKVTDSAAVQACFDFLDEHQVLVEPACGAALSVLREECKVLSAFRTIVVIVCGGSTTALSQLLAWKS